MSLLSPVLYITDLSDERFDPADLFDIAFLLRSDQHDLRGICLTDSEIDGVSLLVDLLRRAGREHLPIWQGLAGLHAALADAPAQINLIVVGGYDAAAHLLSEQREVMRNKAARLFLVGGHANRYDIERLSGERLPIDPRLREQNGERFLPTGDARVGTKAADWAKLLTSGEGVIWLPRDICLWRYAAPSLLSEGGLLTQWLLRETARRSDGSASAPVLLSALPALLLAVQPDPFAWMRLFRVVTARVETNQEGSITTLTTRTDAPNLYVVIAIDGQALGKLLTSRLRDRPLSASLSQE